MCGRRVGPEEGMVWLSSPVFIDGKLSQRESCSFHSHLADGAGTGMQAWSLASPPAFPSPGSYFVTALDEAIHCIAAPSLQRLFQVLGGGMCKPKLSELTDPDPRGGQVPRIVPENTSGVVSGTIY